MSASVIRAAVPALAALLAASACASEQPNAQPAGDELAVQRYQVTATVLQSPRHGPQLCAAVQTSLPPQCGGPDIVGWDWSKVQAESRNGTTWGEYHLVGTYDGKRFTLTEPAKPPKRPEPENDEAGGTTPCAEPEGGWRPVEETKATEEALSATNQRVRSVREFAGSWVDQRYLNEYDLPPNDPRRESVANDPKRLILNVTFTGDLDGREEWIREVWGGALCVSSAEHSERKLTQIQNKVMQEVEGVISGGVDTIGNYVDVQVYLATDEQQRELDAKYGAGVVRVGGFLRPVG